MWSGFFHIDLAPAILRFGIQLRALSKCKINLPEIALFIGEWPWHRDTTSPKGRTVLTDNLHDASISDIHLLFLGLLFCHLERSDEPNETRRPKDEAN